MPRSILWLLVTALTAGLAPQGRLFTLDDLDRIRQPSNVALSPNGAWTSYVLGDALWLASTSGQGPHREVADGMSNQIHYTRPFQAWSPDGSRLLLRRGSDGVHGQGVPFVYEVGEDRLRPLLPDALADRLQTFLHWAAGPPAWSPDGSRVAFLAVDSTTGSGSHLALHVTDVATGDTTVWAREETGPIGGVTTAAWSPDGRWLAYGSGAHRGDSGRVVLLGAEGAEPGRRRLLISGGAPMYRDLSFSPDGRRLAMLVHGGGVSYLDHPSSDVLVDVETGEILDGIPVSSPRWTGDGRLLGTIRSGMSTRLALWDPSAAEKTLLGEPDMVMRLAGTTELAGHTRVAYTAEHGSLPPDVWVAELPAGESELRGRRRLTGVNHWTETVRLARSSVYRWPDPEGESLEAQLFLPPEGVGSEPDPLVVMPYGSYRNEFPRSEYFLEAGIQLLAAGGWAVVRPNTRDPSPEEPAAGRYGEIQLQDTEALIEALAVEGVVDPERVAAIGHSHGGALAYYYLTHSAAFCAVVAVNGWSDWSQIAGRLLAEQEQLHELLPIHSPLANVDAVQAPLLAVSGAGDTQVLPENALRMVQALEMLGRPAELLHYEDEGHLIQAPENRRKLWARVPAFLDESCRPGRTTEVDHGS